LRRHRGGLVEIADHAIHVDRRRLEDLVDFFVVEFVGFRFLVHGTGAG
jgi:hypothetical protein